MPEDIQQGADEVSLADWPPMPPMPPPMRLNISLESIEALVIAANHESLSEAARSCNVKEDTFRKRFDALEAWAGVALAQRRPDFILTPDGQRLLPLARQACVSIRAFTSEMSVFQLQNVFLGEIRKPLSGEIRRKHTAAGTIIEMD